MNITDVLIINSLILLSAGVSVFTGFYMGLGFNYKNKRRKSIW